MLKAWLYNGLAVKIIAKKEGGGTVFIRASVPFDPERNASEEQGRAIVTDSLDRLTAAGLDVVSVHCRAGKIRGFTA